MSTRQRPGLTLASLLLASVILPAQGQTPDAFASDGVDSLFPTDGFYAALRWRAEVVNQDPFEKDAIAIPLRARIGYESGALAGFSLKIEYDYIFDFGVDSYNEGAGNTPDRGDFPVIADPAGGDFNQVYLQWQSERGNRLRAGRQNIVYDNSRFIGDVIWRQNEQTYDAVSFQRLGLGGFDLRAAYLDKVQRIFGNDVPAGEHDLDGWIFNASYTVDGLGKAVAYWYDIENHDVAAFSSSSYGLRWLGAPLGEQHPVGYTVEWAHQQDTGNNPVSYSADYLRLDLSVKLGKPTAYLGYESLGGDRTRAGAAFRTPLATLHAFNGWADKFLATPDAGLVDVFAGIKGPLGNWSWNVLWHDFNAESSSESFGTELDASLFRKFDNGLALLLKGAAFETDSPAYGDTLKLWVQVGYTF